MFTWLCKFWFKQKGWKIEGHLPNLPKYIIAVAPHTSFQDFIIGVATRSLTRMKNTYFLGKDSLFNAYTGWFFRYMGGYPVDRSHNTDFVNTVVKMFNDHKEFKLGMSPEGTRDKVHKLRTGFYYIAIGAKIPIVLCGFDYAKRRVTFDKPFYPTGEYESDMAYILNYYRNITGKNPEKGLLHL
jgi:1-acyl-sn-glycerol-3-phosphate acyltransferase